MNEIIPGAKYKHYKGGLYEIVALGKHTETLEELVVYKNSENIVWVRPLSMFIEQININDTVQPRFTAIT